MDAQKRGVARSRLASLCNALAEDGNAGDVSAARTAIVEALDVLGNDSASFKASDYAVARVHARLARLVGYHDLVFSERARDAWTKFKDFVYGTARDDLRGVGGLTLG